MAPHPCRDGEECSTREDPAEGPDIEAAEMEMLMDDILHRRKSSSSATAAHRKSLLAARLSVDDTERSGRGSSAARHSSSTVASKSSTPSGGRRRRSSLLSESVGGYGRPEARVHSLEDEEQDLSGAEAVEGEKRRRKSSGRRGSADSAGDRGSDSIIDRMRAVAPTVKRRSSGLLRQVTTAAVEAAASIPAVGRMGSASTLAQSSAVPALAAVADGAIRRASLLSLAVRSRAAAAAVEGTSYGDENDAETDAKERAMSIWNLEFHDPILEKAFRKHYRSWVIPRVRVGLQIQMALHFFFGALELMNGYTEGVVMAVLCLRLAVMVSLTAFSWMTIAPKFHRVMDPLALGFYTLNSVLLVLIDVVGSWRGSEATSAGVSVYFFFEGRWSLPSSLMFVVIVYHISGLRYSYANIVAWTHYFLLWLGMVSSFCCRRQSFGSFFTQSAALVPILMVLSMISSNTVERQIRDDFFLRCNISTERSRADEICSSMLPPRVSDLLQNGSAVEDVLQDCPEITILFCYITGFKELTTSCDPYDLVDFVNLLFTYFDKCTEYHHVYKLEAIDCSYLCCAGGGQEGEGDNLAPPADRIWDMALTMLAVAAHGSKLPAAVGAKESGGGAVLKIGVHSGRAVGGVSGVKSFSYHLFGDTINMASRTASTGLPGRVQLSQAAYKCLSPEKQSACETRRGVAMKGKGIIDTHLATFDPAGLGQRLWRNFRRFEKMTKVYDPNFQNLGNKGGGAKNKEGGLGSQEGKLEKIRVKKLKFSLKGSNYEDAQLAGLSDELEKEYQHQYNGSRLEHFQIFLMVALVCLCASLGLDSYNNATDEDEGALILAMRIAVCILLVIVLLCTRDPAFVNWIQVAGAFVAIMFCFTLNALLLLVPEYHMMDMNIISLITISLLMDLQYPYVLVVNVLDVVAYTVAMVVANTHDVNDMVGYLLFVYGAALIGSYACNKREREFRYTYLHKRILKDNKVKAEDLLKNMYPNLRHVRALVRGRRVVDHLEDVTIMFSDLKGYTQWASEESPREVYRVLNKVYTAFDRHLDALGVYKLDTVGDAFVVVAGLEGFKSKEDHAMAMVKYAFRMLFELERIKTEEDLNFEMRIGLHTGPCIGGVIGRLKPRYLCWGRTPLISNELEAAGTPGKLLVSSATFAQLNKQVLVTRGLQFRPGEPLHVKTFDDMADTQVTTFFIEMDSITALTILANEIAEDRTVERARDGSRVEDDPDLSGVEDDGKSIRNVLGVNRLKRLFQTKNGREETGLGTFDFPHTTAIGGGRGVGGGGVGGGSGNPSRRPNHVGSSGLSMTTQSAYLASPPSLPDSNQRTPLSPTAWAAGDAPTQAPFPSGRGGGIQAGRAPAGEGTRLRRVSSARDERRGKQKRRSSSFDAALNGDRGSLGGGAGGGARNSLQEAIDAAAAALQGAGASVGDPSGAPPTSAAGGQTPTKREPSNAGREGGEDGGGFKSSDRSENGGSSGARKRVGEDASDSEASNLSDRGGRKGSNRSDRDSGGRRKSRPKATSGYDSSTSASPRASGSSSDGRDRLGSDKEEESIDGGSESDDGDGNGTAPDAARASRKKRRRKTGRRRKKGLRRESSGSGKSRDGDGDEAEDESGRVSEGSRNGSTASIGLFSGSSSDSDPELEGGDDS